MVLLLDRHLRETGWFDSPIPEGAVDRFVGGFWRGDRFVDRTDNDEVTGDATVVPFYFGVVPDELGLRSALDAAAAAGLTRPLPLRYARRRVRSIERPRDTDVRARLPGQRHLDLARCHVPAPAPTIGSGWRPVQS